MNALVVSGCALAGALTGVALDIAAARVPPARDRIDVEVGTTDGRSLPPDEHADRVSSSETPGRSSHDADADRDAPPLTGVAEIGPGPPGALELASAAVVTAVLFGAAAVRFGAVPALAAYCVFFAGLVVLSIADIRVGLVPRKFLYPTLALMAVGLVAASAVGDNWWAMVHASVGGVGAFFVFVVIYVLYPRGMGFGDVRLAGLMGAALGWLGYVSLYVGFVAGFFVGAVYGVVTMAVVRGGRKTRFPFGPGLAVGAVVGVLFGGWLASYWVLHST